MSRETEELKRRLAVARAQRPSRIPAALKLDIVRWARREHSHGHSWERLALRLGVGADTVRKWASGEPAVRRTPPRSTGELLPVRVVETTVAEEEAGALVLVTPAGWRVEGLTLSCVAKLLRDLS